MSDLEQAALAECEQVVARGFHHFVEVGEALVRIRDENLYQYAADANGEVYGTFEAYVRGRWDKTDAWARQQMRAFEALRTLPPQARRELTNERQLRELVPLNPEQRGAAFEEARLRAQSEGRAISARDLHEARWHQQAGPVPVQPQESSPEAESEVGEAETGWGVILHGVKAANRFEQELQLRHDLTPEQIYRLQHKRESVRREVDHGVDR